MEKCKTYSMSKMVGGLTEFDERKFLTWTDFLEEFEQRCKNELPLKLDKDELSSIKQYIQEGNTIQEILERKSETFRTYKDYISTMLFSMSAQDNIIEEMKTYFEQIKIWKQEDYIELQKKAERKRLKEEKEKLKLLEV